MYSAKQTRGELVARGAKGGVAVAAASLVGSTAAPVGISFPAHLDIEQASESLAPFLS